MLRSNVKLVLEPGAGARLVDDQGQRSVTLTATEGRIVALIAPGATAESLAAAAKGAGLDVDAAQVEALLTRLRANELIDYSPSGAMKGPKVMLMEDVVPAFRTDLGVAPGQKAGLMLVTDRKRNRSFTLYDFEVHIARLLDGSHTVAQVIEQAGRIGIPVTPESLATFIAQMRAYGFITSGPLSTPLAEDQTWPSRSQWGPEIRELYQQALKQFRLGRPAPALEYLASLLAIRPDTPEALELKKRVEEQVTAGPVTELSFEDLHGVEEPMPALVAAADVLTGGGPVATLPAAAVGEQPLTPSGRAMALGDSPSTPSGKVRALGEKFASKPFTLGEPAFGSGKFSGFGQEVPSSGKYPGLGALASSSSVLGEPSVGGTGSVGALGASPASGASGLGGSPAPSGSASALGGSPAPSGTTSALSGSPATGGSSSASGAPSSLTGSTLGASPAPSLSTSASGAPPSPGSTTAAPSAAPVPKRAPIYGRPPGAPIFGKPPPPPKPPQPPPPATATPQLVPTLDSPTAATQVLPTIPAPPAPVSPFATTQIVPPRASSPSLEKTQVSPPRPSAPVPPPSPSPPPPPPLEKTQISPARPSAPLPSPSPPPPLEKTQISPARPSAPLPPPSPPLEKTQVSPPRSSPPIPAPASSPPAAPRSSPPLLREAPPPRSSPPATQELPQARSSPPVLEEQPPPRSSPAHTQEIPAPHSSPPGIATDLVPSRVTAELPRPSPPALAASPPPSTDVTHARTEMDLPPVASSLEVPGPPVPRPSEARADRPREVTLDVPTAKQEANPPDDSPLASEATEIMPAVPAKPSAPVRMRRGPAEPEPAKPSAPKPPRASRPKPEARESEPATTPERPSRRPAPRTAKKDEAPPSRLPLIIGGAVVLLGGLAFPIPYVEKTKVELVASTKAEPKMPAGVFGELKIQPGTRVDENTIIATLDVGKQKAQREELLKTAARLDAAAARTLAKTNAALVKKAKLAVAKASQDLAKAKAVPAKRRDEKAELDISRKEAVLEKAERYLTAVDGSEKAKSLKAEAAATRERAAALQKAVDRAFVVAPASGVFELETLPPAGAQFDEGSAFGRIVDRSLLIKGAPAEANDAVLVVGDKRVSLFSVDKRPEGLTVPFEGGVKPGPAVLEVSKGYRPWPMVVLAR